RAAIRCSPASRRGGSCRSASTSISSKDVSRGRASREALLAGLLAADLGDEGHLDRPAGAVRAGLGNRDRPLGGRGAAEGADDADLELRVGVAAAPVGRRRRDGERASGRHGDGLGQLGERSRVGIDPDRERPIAEAAERTEREALQRPRACEERDRVAEAVDDLRVRRPGVARPGVGKRSGSCGDDRQHRRQCQRGHELAHVSHLVGSRPSGRSGAGKLPPSPGEANRDGIRFAPVAYPNVDTTAASALGAALRRVRYSEQSVLDMLGDDAYSHDREELPRDERRVAPTRLGTVVRGIFLQRPVPRPELVAALGERAVAALESIGFAERADVYRPRSRILPVGDLYVASDDYPHHDPRGAPPDYVAAYTLPSRVCDCLTPRVRGARALDVGTGSGVQALLAARLASRVVATDINPRALAFTEVNAALNGFTNIEVRLGSL